MVPDSIWAHHPLSSYARLVYVYLCHRADYADRTAFPSYRRMAHDLECSRSQIIRAITELITARLLEKSHRVSSRGDLTSNLYTLIDPEDVDTISGSVSQIPPSSCQTPPLVSDRNHLPRNKTRTPYSPKRLRVLLIILTRFL